LLKQGLGATYATNVVIPVVSVLTSIGMDHSQILGGTLGAIATEKAGIIKGNVPVLTAPQEPEVAERIRNRCRKGGCSDDGYRSLVSRERLGFWEKHSGGMPRWRLRLWKQEVFGFRLKCSAPVWLK